MTFIVNRSDVVTSSIFLGPFTTGLAIVWKYENGSLIFSDHVLVRSGYAVIWLAGSGEN